MTIKPRRSAVRPASPQRSRPSPSFKGGARFREDRSEESDFEDTSEGPRPLVKRAAAPKAANIKVEQVSKAFVGIWEKLFQSPVHLDSALSKQMKGMKTILARIVPTILLRPASQAEALGIGVGLNEPWGLTPEQIAKWRPAVIMAERMYVGMTHRPIETDVMREDFPQAMIDEWERHWGGAVTGHLMDTLAREAPLSLRASKKVGPEALVHALKTENRVPVKVGVSDFAPMGVRLSGYAPVLGTDAYKNASFEIQDEGSQVMALFALWPERFGGLLGSEPSAVEPLSKSIELPAETPNWTVVDACAGAGGKTLAIADAMGGKGRIYSYDTSEKKLQALRRRATHAGYNNIQAVALEEGKEAEKLKRFRRTAQVVLVDAPCSGWGVLRRNPDIKWRQTPDVLDRMPKIQKRLLSTYSDMVAPGGRLVFGVCTFRPEETREVVQAFLEEHPDFEAREGGFLGPGPCDGFFMQSFQRRPK
jgi:16S rRNA C967 or C1407 C5-methylase (RsmB/RsmF family)